MIPVIWCGLADQMLAKSFARVVMLAPGRIHRPKLPHALSVCIVPVVPNNRFWLLHHHIRCYSKGFAVQVTDQPAVIVKSILLPSKR